MSLPTYLFQIVTYLNQSQMNNFYVYYRNNSMLMGLENMENMEVMMI